ncbi:MAG TPA: secondary thiamine-phosphate synthase enzyme YjbQ [Actinomycetota bacterium]|nr:secondary thiamine-phosphate synthase enzyme YjbQ [Actinomycetota bacterium]
MTGIPVIAFREFSTKTGGRLDALDVTPEVMELVRESGVKSGSVLVFSPHTTCCVLLAPAAQETVQSIEQMIASLAPANGYYAHDDLDIRTENLQEQEPPNAPSHIAHVFMGKASETLPIVDGEIPLGPNQRVLFVELDSSRDRRYCVQVIGE